MPPRKTKSQGQPASPANPHPPEFRKISITDVLPDPKNPRRDLHAGDPEYHNIQNSIDEFGFVDPIIIDTETREVIGGHQRLTVLRDMGVTELYEIPLGGITWLTPDIDLKQLTKPQRTALNIALNKITGDWDNEKLVEALNGIKLDGLDITITGFGEKELVTFMADLQKGKEPQDAEPQISRAEELRKEWGTELGQIWQCGSHRIICGDCTDPAVVARLLRSGTPAAEVPKMVNTDPPYGLGGYAGRSGKFDAVEGDDQDTLIFYQVIPAAIKERYVWCEWRTYPTLLKALGQPRSLIVWAKNNFGMGKGYRRQHEFCAYYGDFQSTTESDLWEVNKDTTYQHPTQKPIELATRAITNSSKAGDIVIDYFLGAGFTMIACENLGRKCRGCEIDPGYVAVCLQRYKDVTGKDPVLVTE